MLQTISVPVLWQWLAMGLLGLGAITIFRCRGSLGEVAGWVMFGLGFSGLGTLIAVGMITPTSPGYTISLAAPVDGGHVSSPVRVTVCARNPNGSVATTPDRDNVLAVLLDGSEVGAMHAAGFDVVVPSGRHQVAVELLTRDHHVFNPHVAAAAEITVDGTAVPGAGPVCPAQSPR